MQYLYLRVALLYFVVYSVATFKHLLSTVCMYCFSFEFYVSVKTLI